MSRARFAVFEGNSVRDQTLERDAVTFVLDSVYDLAFDDVADSA